MKPNNNIGRSGSKWLLALSLPVLCGGLVLIGVFLGRWMMPKQKPAQPPSYLLAGPKGSQNQARPRELSDEIIRRQLEALRAHPPLPGLSFVIEKPFVVAGDEEPRIVRRRAEQTVRWAVNLLKQAYFPDDPDEVITIYLFGDKAGYEKGAAALVDHAPDTPFGFFAPGRRVMVMNIATGGGTLVHEIVHALLAPNFPECPAWFNEGLGSLYEQSAQRDGRIVGLTNWRLAGLQRAIRQKAVPPFRKLTGTTTEQFYGDPESGVYYAQARYLCYFLQERGKLQAFYRAFRDNVSTDPTGYQTLRKILGRGDMEKFQSEWEDFCLKLRFPE
jgi:hypothetical protein